jgi:hypothetical protein
VSLRPWHDERTPWDAPLILTADRSEAWAEGYNAAVEAARVDGGRHVAEVMDPETLIEMAELVEAALAYCRLGGLHAHNAVVGRLINAGMVVRKRRGEWVPDAYR